MLRILARASALLFASQIASAYVFWPLSSSSRHDDRESISESHGQVASTFMQVDKDGQPTLKVFMTKTPIDLNRTFASRSVSDGWNSLDSWSDFGKQLLTDIRETFDHLLPDKEDPPPPPPPPHHRHPPHGPPPPHHKPPHHKPPHHKPSHHKSHKHYKPPRQTFPKVVFDSNLSLVDNILAEKRFSMLSKFLTERPDIVTALNSTDREFTVLAPIDHRKTKFSNHANKISEVLDRLGFTSMKPDMKFMDLAPGAFHDGCPEHGGKPSFENITDALLYHILQEAVSFDSLSELSVVDSSLALSTLGDKQQKIRVLTDDDDINLNFMADIVQHDLKGSNGILHVLDHYLLPPPTVVITLAHIPCFFGLFLALAKRAGIAEKLDKAVGITVFVPTNKAIKKMGARTIAHLFSHAGQEDLIQILAAHVSTSLVYESDIFKNDGKLTIPSYLEGQEISLVGKEKKHAERSIRVNNLANVLFADGPTANGAVHVIDKVLKVLDFNDNDEVEKYSPEEEDAVFIEQLNGMPGLEYMNVKEWFA